MEPCPSGASSLDVNARQAQLFVFFIHSHNKSAQVYDIAIELIFAVISHPAWEEIMIGSVHSHSLPGRGLKLVSGRTNPNAGFPSVSPRLTK